MRSSSCTGSTTYGAAAEFAGVRRCWVPRLSLKPLLCLDVDGRLVLGQRIRTATKAHAAMIDQVAEVVGDGSAQIAVHHVDNRDTADDIAKTLTVRLPQIAPPTVTDMGPVLAVHVGAGAVGVCVGGRRLVTWLDLARAEREDFAAFLETLSPEQWEAPTLCDRWNVREVAAHAISFDELGGGEMVRRFMQGRLNTDRINEVGVADYADRSPEQFVALLRRTPRRMG